MSCKFEELLKEAYQTEQEPSGDLNSSVLKKMEERSMKKNKIRSLGTAAAACAASCILISTGVFAGPKVIRYFKEEIKKSQYAVKVDVEKGKNFKQNIPYVALSCKVPKGYREEQEESSAGYYDFSWKKEIQTGKDYSLELIQMDQEVKDDYFISDVKASSKLKINGHKAIFLDRYGIKGSRYNDKKEYTKGMVVFYDEYGYMIRYYAEGDLNKKDLTEIASGVTMKKCKKTEASSYTKISNELEGRIQGQETWDGNIGSAKDVLNAVGDKVQHHNILYQAVSVDVRDNIRGMEQSGFSDDIDLSQIAYKNGKLKPYQRETLKIGDGHTNPSAKVIKTEKVKQKFVAVTLKMKNMGSEKEQIMACREISYLMYKNGGMYHDKTDYQRPESVEACQMDSRSQYFKENEGGSQFYLKTLKAGQEAVYHIGFFIDEDLLNKSYIKLDQGENEKSKDLKYIKLN